MKRALLLTLFLTLFATSRLPLVTQGQTNAAITIVKPGDRRNVELGKVTVTVQLAGVAPGDGHTWQMLIDGVPQGMVREGLTTEIDIPRPSGPHRLKAELYDASGKAIASNEILVMAAPVESREPVFNRAWFVPFAAVFTVAIIGIILLGLRLRPRLTT
jgi:hypothetical protein